MTHEFFLKFQSLKDMNFYISKQINSLFDFWLYD